MRISGISLISSSLSSLFIIIHVSETARLGPVVKKLKNKTINSTVLVYKLSDSLVASGILYGYLIAWSLHLHDSTLFKDK